MILFIGLTVAHLGVTLFLLTDMGADPFNVLIQGLYKSADSLISPKITHGMVHIAVSFLIILILLAADKSYIKAGTVVCMVCGGPIIDLFSKLLSGLRINERVLPVKIFALILGCVILGFGKTLVIRSEAGTGPNDLVSVVISEKLKKRLGVVMVIVEVTYVLTGFLLGGKFGAGTLICAFLVGFVADFFMPISRKLVGRGLKLANIQQAENEV